MNITQTLINMGIQQGIQSTWEEVWEESERCKALKIAENLSDILEITQPSPRRTQKI